MFLTLGQLISRYCPVDASACQTEPATRPRRVDPSHAAPAGQAWHVICGLLGSRIYSFDWQGTHCWLTAEKTPPTEFSRWLPYDTPSKTLPQNSNMVRATTGGQPLRIYSPVILLGTHVEPLSKPCKELPSHWAPMGQT